jgi:hypothetical protein
MSQPPILKNVVLLLDRAGLSLSLSLVYIFKSYKIQILQLNKCIAYCIKVLNNASII